MSTRTRVKICGITSIVDALAAVNCGADALGLVFYPASKRFVTAELAHEISKAIPPFVTLTGLFVDAKPAEIESILNKVPLGLLQFHGDEPDSYCRYFGSPYIKALRIQDGIDINAKARAYPGANGLLLDTYVTGVAGGTGHKFNWSLIPPDIRSNVTLAGGLTAENVTAAITQIRPYAVDVSTGVEVSAGVKDHSSIAAFCAAVNAADQLLYRP